MNRYRMEHEGRFLSEPSSSKSITIHIYRRCVHCLQPRTSTYEISPMSSIGQNNDVKTPMMLRDHRIRNIQKGRRRYFTIFCSRVCWKRESEQEWASPCQNHRNCYKSSSLSRCTYHNRRRCQTTSCTYTALFEFHYKWRTASRQPSACALRHPKSTSPSTRPPRPTHPEPPEPLPPETCLQPRCSSLTSIPR